MSAEEACGIVPGSAEWLVERGRRIGASEAAACLGWSRYCRPRELAERKRAALAGAPFPQDTESQQQHRGHALEAVVLRLYERKTGIHVEPSRFVVHMEHDWASATPDGFRADGRGLVQAKTHLDWLAKQYGADGGTEIPDHEYVQVQHEMACTGLESTDLAVLFGAEQALDILTALIDTGADLESVVNLASNMDFRVFTVARSDSFIADLFAAEEEFWTRYVVGSEIPDDIQTAASRDSVRQATADEEAVLARLFAAYIVNKDSEVEVKALRAKVEDIIGTDGGIECEAGKITWKSKAEKTTESVCYEAIAVKLLKEMDPAARAAIVTKFTTIAKSGGGRTFNVYPAGRKRGGKKS